MTAPLRSLGPVNLLFVSLIFLSILMPFLMRIYGPQMYFFYFIMYGWAGLYILFLAALVRKHLLGDYRLIVGRGSVIIAVVLIAVTRLVFLGMTETISLDALWYLDFGSMIKTGSVAYFSFFLPYPPVFAYLAVGISYLAPCVDSFRVVMTIAAIGVALVLYKLTTRYVGASWGGSAALIYGLLPIAVIDTGWSGHFEAFANLLMLTAIWFMLARRPLLTGMFVGLAAATKLYPVLLFPIAIFYFHGWRPRTKMTLAAIGSGGLTFAPFLLQYLSSSTPSSLSGLGILEMIESQVRSILGVGLAWPVNTMAIVAAVLMLAASLWLAKHRDPGSRSTSYNLAVLLLGILLIAMGTLAGIYPLTLESRFVLWRYPADIGVLRGLCTIVVGAALMYQAVSGLRESTGRDLSVESLELLGLAIALLLISMVRSQVYGWYLLWSIPVFLLLKNRQLALTATICLLLVYPGYTHDNFASLGFQEQRAWDDDMAEVGSWSVHINTIGSCADPDNISGGVAFEGGRARFWFDTSRLANTSCLDNVTVQFTEAVNVSFGPFTEFVTSIKTDWDPTFGRHATFSLAFQGVLENGTMIDAVIVPTTTPLTNLTWTSCRYAFASHSAGMSGHAINLTVTVTPRILARSQYDIAYMYTTYDGPLDTTYLPVVVSLFAFVLLSFVVLTRELSKLPSTESSAAAGVQ